MQLKCGGPLMVVADEHDGKVELRWMDSSGKPQAMFLPEACVEPASREPASPETDEHEGNPEKDCFHCVYSGKACHEDPCAECVKHEFGEPGCRWEPK